MELKVSEDDDDMHVIAPEVVRRFEGGKQQVKLSRSRIFSHPFNENSALICSGDEDSKGALVWDLSSDKYIQKLKSDSTVLDMCLLQNMNTNSYFMTSLTETSVLFYKYICYLRSLLKATAKPGIQWIYGYIYVFCLYPSLFGREIHVLFIV